MFRFNKPYFAAVASRYKGNAISQTHICKGWNEDLAGDFPEASFAGTGTISWSTSEKGSCIDCIWANYGGQTPEMGCFVRDSQKSPSFRFRNCSLSRLYLWSGQQCQSLQWHPTKIRNDTILVLLNGRYFGLMGISYDFFKQLQNFADK